MAHDLHDVARQFSQRYPVMSDAQRRYQKGLKVSAILKDALQQREVRYILDVGCSNALLLDVIVASLQPHLALGIDMDVHVLPRPTPQRIAMVGDALHLPIEDASIDIVICNHTYEHIPDAGKLFSDIKRVLKPGGIVYLGAMNAIWPIEPHYNLPFIHWLPKNWSAPIMRILGQPQGYLEKPLGAAKLCDLVSDFEVHGYTLKVIARPSQYYAEDMVPPKLARILLPLAKLLYGMLPVYLWVLVKREKNG